MLRLALLCCLALMVSCKDRPPVNRAMAGAIADAYLADEGEDWGSPWRIEEIPGPDEKGRFWWRIVYTPGLDGEYRGVLVNKYSRWVKLAPTPDYKIYEELETLPEGPYIVVFTEERAFPEDRTSFLQGLNRQANGAGLPSLFTIRGDGRGTEILTYGWNGGAGTIKSTPLLKKLEQIAQPAAVPWFDIDSLTFSN